MIIVEVQEIGNLFRVISHHIAENEDSPDFSALQRVIDESADKDFHSVEIRDTLRALLQRTDLETREREIVNLVLKGWDFVDISQHLKISRQCVQTTFWRAVAKLRQTAKALGISP